MSWIKEARTKLQNGQNARVRPFGGSMRGRIESGQLVTIALVQIRDVHSGDVVFLEWKGNYLLHLVVEIEPERVLIGNTLGKDQWLGAGFGNTR
jgi:hypothetical protein